MASSKSAQAAMAALGPLDSRYVTVADLPWQATPFPGIQIKMLYDLKQ